jgi:7-carboxy-7-deazaguanine synthase
MGRAGWTGKLSVFEIYASIQGESTLAGWPCVLIRLAGCPFRCRYCDTAEARDERAGTPLSIPEILDRVRGFGLELVNVSGGEPLAQKGARPLVAALIQAGHHVTIETGNSVTLADVDARAQIILDIKTPGSGMFDCQVWDNLELLQPTDELKFVLCSRDDYEWARGFILERKLGDRQVINFSPVEPVVGAPAGISKADLARWIVADRLPVRLNLQLQVWIWGRDARGV